MKKEKWKMESKKMLTKKDYFKSYSKRHQSNHVPLCYKLLLYLIDHDVKQERKNSIHSKL